MNARDAYKKRAGRVLISMDHCRLPEAVAGRIEERFNTRQQSGLECWVDDAGYYWLVEGAVAQPSDCISFCVEDWGSGISSEALPQIFTPFFTTKERGQGTGFGLSIVHGVALAHNGAVMVRTKVGYGTRVEVLIPTFRRETDCQ
jgi:signal transduction histidine kinase